MSETKRESGAGADVEVFYTAIKVVGCGRCGGETEMPQGAVPYCYTCGDDARVNKIEGTQRSGWFWRSSAPVGPFATEAEARADADADLRVMRHVHSVIAGECFECGSLGKQACAHDCTTQRQPDAESNGAEVEP